jgi:hypothetical protein
MVAGIDVQLVCEAIGRRELPVGVFVEDRKRPDLDRADPIARGL